jgi:hypothetical protein
VNSYIRGKTVKVTGSFHDPDTLAGMTPTVLTLRVIDPTGTEQTPVTTGFGVPFPGVYTSTIVATRPGEWKYRFEASGLFEDACENTFLVSDSAFRPD